MLAGAKARQARRAAVGLARATGRRSRWRSGRVSIGCTRATNPLSTRYPISSAKLSPEQAASAVRGHWGIENQLHWMLDVVFAEDQSRLRKGHGAKNMAVVRHFAINLIRAATDKKSIKLRRQIAGWDPNYLAKCLGALPR